MAFPTKLIVARAANHVIGYENGDLPWHLPDDFKYFKEVTLGCPVIMGRKTFDSIGRFLPGRFNIILTTNAGLWGNKEDHADGVTSHQYVGDLSHIPEDLSDGFVIGGGEIYKKALTSWNVEELYVTEVWYEAPEEDSVKFTFDDKLFVLESSELHESDEKHKYPFSFCKYRKA